MTNIGAMRFLAQGQFQPARSSHELAFWLAIGVLLLSFPSSAWERTAEKLRFASDPSHQSVVTSTIPGNPA